MAQTRKQSTPSQTGRGSERRHEIPPFTSYLKTLGLLACPAERTNLRPVVRSIGRSDRDRTSKPFLTHKSRTSTHSWTSLEASRRAPDSLETYHLLEVVRGM